MRHQFANIREGFPLPTEKSSIELLDQMKQNDVIRPSSSAWASPIVLAKKKDGGVRFCIDFRRVNKVTRKDAYPLPRIDDTLETLSQSQLFSTLDLASGYWQVDLQKSPARKQLFSTTDVHIRGR